MAANDPFAGMNPGPSGPYVHGAAITPSDTTKFDIPYRGVWVGGTGALRVTLRDMLDTEYLTIPAVPANVLLPLWVKKVWATGTTATNIIAFR